MCGQPKDRRQCRSPSRRKVRDYKGTGNSHAGVKRGCGLSARLVHSALFGLFFSQTPLRSCPLWRTGRRQECLRPRVGTFQRFRQRGMIGRRDCGQKTRPSGGVVRGGRVVVKTLYPVVCPPSGAFGFFSGPKSFFKLWQAHGGFAIPVGFLQSAFEPSQPRSHPSPSKGLQKGSSSE